MLRPLRLAHLKTFCALRGCRLRYGHPEMGFLAVDSGGIVDPRAYSSYTPSGEMTARPDPLFLLERANTFVIWDDGDAETLTREQFLDRLERCTGPLQSA